MSSDFRPPALLLRPGGPLSVPAPEARGGRVVLLGIDMDPFDAAELSEQIAAAAEEAAAGERLVIVPAGRGGREGGL